MVVCQTSEHPANTNPLSDLEATLKYYVLIILLQTKQQRSVTNILVSQVGASGTLPAYLDSVSLQWRATQSAGAQYGCHRRQTKIQNDPIFELGYLGQVKVSDSLRPVHCQVKLGAKIMHSMVRSFRSNVGAAKKIIYYSMIFCVTW